MNRFRDMYYRVSLRYMGKNFCSRILFSNPLLLFHLIKDQCMPNYFKIVQYLQVAHLHFSVYHFPNDDPQYVPIIKEIPNNHKPAQ